ncbi:RNA methyltransferase, TrmH family [Aspergillus nomiae NRRL 13137]|uniref:rRNA methyltransferase 1, mitochondrial n=1 Tax=Aspergillus nomiae NRRL (strain ATCC 15546 / NRRL 13137 / CBS 260.88 / M93) TaxID=1509407 RepID=A0A0L1J021_ASPN3|nr:RNA methyltransferase, TrmH family [Aspergillus nomiae NRRL 13137]KNG85092.1 RNA methyltransferase, TrmH family [Aspergillus nomiae NRRL 13137]
MSHRSLLKPLHSYMRLSIAPSIHLNHVRRASLNSAIGRGIRKTRGFDGPSSSRNSYDSDFERPYRERRDPKPNRTEKKTQGRNWVDGEFDEDEFIRTGNFRALPREHQRFQSSKRLSNNEDRGYDNRETSDRPHDKRHQRFQSSQRSSRNEVRGYDDRETSDRPQDKRYPRRAEPPKHHRATERVPERVKENVQVPDAIPYTTPASEFIYGTSAVEAALRCSRRRLYKLYVYQAAGEELSPAKVALRKLALVKNVKVKMAFGGWDRLLDKMSAGRPHNGCVLEASPLPRLPVRGLKSVPSVKEEDFGVELGAQSREEALVNSTNDKLKIHHWDHRTRYPVVLLLDGIVDPGNLGAIIRSAYYLGVDAIIFAGRNSAPLSPVTIKASAGAAENMSLLEVSNEVDFIQRSKANGWKFYAADAPGPASKYVDNTSIVEGKGTTEGGHFSTQSPCVIMMGSEGSGLSRHIKSHADSIVSIPGARLTTPLGVESDPSRVDSLNVSVAAALLMEMFLRVPLAVADVRPKKSR